MNGYPRNNLTFICEYNYILLNLYYWSDFDERQSY